MICYEKEGSAEGDAGGSTSGGEMDSDGYTDRVRCLFEHTVADRIVIKPFLNNQKTKNYACKLD